MRLAASYFFLQATLGVAWWIWLWLDDRAAAHFVPDVFPTGVLHVFWLADLLLFVGGSLTTGVLLARARDGLRRGTLPCVWLTFGATGYAALIAVAMALLDGAAWLGAATMIPAALATGVCAIGAERFRS